MVLVVDRRPQFVSMWAFPSVACVSMAWRLAFLGMNDPKESKVEAVMSFMT